MRRVCGALFFAVLFQLLSPSPAHAWWEWLDELSGPKGLKGPQFEARLVCFGDNLPANLSVVLSDAAAATANARIVNTDDAWQAAAKKWQEAAMAWNRVAVALHVFSDQDIKAIREAQDKARALEPKSWEQAAKAWEDVANRGVRAANSAVTATGSFGVLWSFCSTNKIRRASIDLGITFLRTDDARFANRRGLKLTTVIPSFSWRVFPDPRYDVVDVGIGGGMYSFTSEAFESFSGVILQPWRADFHAPSSWSGAPLSSPKRWLAVPMLRVGHMIFPAGFERNAFAAGPGTDPRRIPAELTFSKSIFLNLEPFVRRATQ